MNAPRTLAAFINTRRIGELRDENGIWALAYDPAWVKDPEGFGLSPALSRQQGSIVDQSSTRPVQWYFDNLLPEEGARVLLARDVRIDVEDAFGLLSAYGAESAGSLTLTSGDLDDRSGTRPLPEDDLQARIERLPNVPLTQGSAKRMSLAGVQHKLAVVVSGNDILEPIGRTPSTHILKPNHSDSDYPHSVINEYLVMKLARALRLDVPDVIRKYVPAPIYLVKRFDRRSKNGTVERLHLIDACQALNLDRQFKYRAGSIDRLKDLSERCSAPAAARLKLFGWLVFNLLIGNSDAHLKNISFLVDSHGTRVAPFYDLLAVGVYGAPAFGKQEWPHVPLAFPLLGRARFSDINRQAVLEAGEALGIRKDTAHRLIEEQVRRIQPEADELMQSIEAENKQLTRVRPELAATFAGESRCLRAIVSIVIRDMVNTMH